jgi:hypothetical protein
MNKISQELFHILLYLFFVLN